MTRFVDTFYYVALLHPKDEHHFAVKHYQSRLREPVVTTDAVLIEVANIHVPLLASACAYRAETNHARIGSLN